MESSQPRLALKKNGKYSTEFQEQSLRKLYEQPMVGHCTVKIEEQKIEERDHFFSFQPVVSGQEFMMEIGQIDRELEHIFREKFPVAFVSILAQVDLSLKMEQITSFLLDQLIVNDGQNMKAYLSQNLGVDQNRKGPITDVIKLSHINQPT